VHYRLLMAKQALTEAAQQGAFARMMGGIQQRQQKLDDLIFRIDKAERKLLEQHRRRWERTSAAVRHYDARRMLAAIRKDLAIHTSSMAAAMRATLLRRKSRLDQIHQQLKALSPVAILERGYALVFDSSGKLVKNSAQVELGDEISTRLAQGTFTARIEKKS
jgi:exodeoxyribonuclease VII large subunit